MSLRRARAFSHDGMSIVIAAGRAAVVASIMGAPAFSQTRSIDEGVAAVSAAGPAKSTKPKTTQSRKQKPKGDQGDKAAPPLPAAPTTLAGAAAAGAGAAPLDIAARLRQAGAGTCAATIDADAVPSMIGVTQSNTLTTWSNVEPRDKHAVSVFVGQHYGSSETVPFGVTGLIASPNASGTCDSTVVQVVASPLPCATVRDTLLKQGTPGGNLAGVELVQSKQDQTLLMPTATNTCVLVGFHSTFRR